MKMLAIAFALLASVVTKSSFASDGAVSPEALKSFQQTFAAAKEADWSITADLYKVQFLLNGQSITAFYTEDGTMAALTRNITVYQLPVHLQTNLKNTYTGYWIADLFEMSNEDVVHYYVTLEDGTSKIILKSSATTWTVFKKERKE